MRLRHVPLDMSFAETFDGRATRTPMSGCCMDVIRGNQTLFMRRDEVEAAWRWVDPIREAWDERRQDAAGLHRRHLGPVRRDRADRARRPDLAREQLRRRHAYNWHAFADAPGTGGSAGRPRCRRA